MRKVEWLIEADVFEENEKQLIEEIKKHKNISYSLVNYSHLDQINFNDWYKKDDCVVFYGSIQLGRKLQKSVPWVPGVYLNEKAFECTSYYPVLGDSLIHSNYILLPYGDLLRMKERIFGEFFKGWDKVFIRPNSGSKEFTGMVIEKDNWEEGIKLAGFYGIDSNMLVLVSTVWALHKEWRFVIVDGTVISGSAYRDWSSKGEESGDYVLKNSQALKDEFDKKNPWDVSAWEAAQSCAHKYNPDRCWTVDVARTVAGTYAILEIGSFSCASLYGANIKEVVKAVSVAALDEWRELNEFYR